MFKVNYKDARKTPVAGYDLLAMANYFWGFGKYNLIRPPSFNKLVKVVTTHFELSARIMLIFSHYFKIFK